MGKRLRSFKGPVLALASLVSLNSGVLRAECPELEYAWTRTIGGTGEDHATGLAVDAEGNVLITGWFSNRVDFDPTEHVESHTSRGRKDVFVTKLNADGSRAWTRTLGGPHTDIAQSIAVGPSGGVVITGWFHESVDFDPTEGTDTRTADGAYEDIFVTKLGSDGSYAWTRTFGTTGSDRAHKVAVDSVGNVLLTGGFWYTVDFDGSRGAPAHTSNGGYDVFVTKLTADGGHTWTRSMGGTLYELGFAIAADINGNVLVGGVYSGSVDFDPTSGVDVHDGTGAFVTKLHGDGSYAWTGTFDSSLAALAWDLAVDAEGGVLTTGYYAGWIDFDPSAGVDGRSGHGTSADIFLNKLDADGRYGWTYTVGHTSYDAGKCIAVAPNGDVLISGHFQRSVDFDPTSAVDSHSSRGWRDVFLTRLRADGTYLWTRTVGGTGYEEGGYAVAVSHRGHVLIAGRFELNVDLDPCEGLVEKQSRGSFDAFVTKLTCIGDDDADGDGVTDCIDLCPDTPEGVPVNTCGCTALGACCFGAGSCWDETERYECPDIGGIYQGDGSVCSNGCGLGDFDADGDVDLSDFAEFQRCFTGGADATVDCSDFDADRCGTVDLDDFEALKAALTGPR